MSENNGGEGARIYLLPPHREGLEDDPFSGFDDATPTQILPDTRKRVNDGATAAIDRFDEAAREIYALTKRAESAENLVGQLGIEIDSARMAVTALEERMRALQREHEYKLALADRDNNVLHAAAERRTAQVSVLRALLRQQEDLSIRDLKRMRRLERKLFTAKERVRELEAVIPVLQNTNTLLERTVNAQWAAMDDLRRMAVASVRATPREAREAMRRLTAAEDEVTRLTVELKRLHEEREERQLQASMGKLLTGRATGLLAWRVCVALALLVAIIHSC